MTTDGMKVKMTPDYHGVVQIYNMKVQLCCRLPFTTGRLEITVSFSLRPR